MGSEWSICKLKEAGITLIDCVHQTPKAQETGIPYIGIPQMDEGRINFDAKPRLISEADFITWTVKAYPQAHDVVLSRRCNPGETAYVPSGAKFALGQNLVLLRADAKKVYPPYLRWLAQGREWWGEVEKYRNPGAIFDSLKCADIPNFSLPIPCLDNQKKISGVLGAIDRKIELNRQMNETLEQMAQALFKSWFVDFDPVIDNALYAGNPIPDELEAKAEQRKQLRESAAKGEVEIPMLPADIRTLFPSEFEFTEAMEWIPKGWSIKPLYDMANFINGAAYKKFEPNSSQNGLPVIKIVELKSGITEKTGFSTVMMPEKYLLKDEDILFSWSGNPDTSIDTFVWSLGPAWLNQHIFRVDPYDCEQRSFLLALLRSLKPVFADIARDKQTTGLGHVTVKDLKTLMVVLPNTEIIKLAANQLGPLFQKCFSLSKENAHLTFTRDNLLPKLISGELKIPDAQHMVEDELQEAV